MDQVRRFAGWPVPIDRDRAFIRLSMVMAAACVLLVSPAPAAAKEPSAVCEEAAGIAVLPSPVAPWKGAPLRVVFTAEKPFEGELALVSPTGSIAARSADRQGGPPYVWFAEVAAPAPGTWQARLTRSDASADCATITREIPVRATQPGRPGAVTGSVWPIRHAWSRGMENLYAAWIEKLFDAPLDATLSWPALHEVLRDRQRNVLFDHLGLGEDKMGMVVRPDCADLPYFLRAYFAFKVGLPFGYAKCTRGGAGQPPKCYEWWNIQNEDPRYPAVPPPEPKGTAAARPISSPPATSTSVFDIFGGASATRPAAPRGASARPVAQVEKPPRIPPRPAGLAPAFGHYLHWSIAESVHSGSGRTAARDDATDYYPVPLSPDALRPGTVYADPYGHLLVLVKRVPQTADAAGVLLAVDAQPDGTVARKRFWRGNFLFAQDPGLGSPGFKRFRPVVRERGTMRRLTNAEILKDPQYADVSLDQSRMAIEEFYDRMEDLMSPAPLDPVRAMTEAITALEEQVNARVTSVENGRKYQNSGRREADMPDGASIFETTGAWEDFATPSRDLRLLIAIDVVRGYPDRVARRPGRYAMPAGKSVADVKSELSGLLVSDLSARKFSYVRSDGSAWKLSIKDVVDRVADLEMAYNVNDCVEMRWGAPERSEEVSTCKRRAPNAQRTKMTDYRTWFQERRRPPRG